MPSFCQIFTFLGQVFCLQSESAPQLRLHWTQEDFAVRLQLAGWHNATRSTVSKIEGGSIGIAEYDLLFIAAALRVHFVHLYPEIDWQRPMDEIVHQHIPHELHDQTTEP